MSLIVVDSILPQCLPSQQLLLAPAPIQSHHAIVAGEAGVDARQDHGDIRQLVANEEFDHRHHVANCRRARPNSLWGIASVAFYEIEKFTAWGFDTADGFTRFNASRYACR
jgi:hypothetical protein